jgi:hypothetical protein
MSATSGKCATRATGGKFVTSECGDSSANGTRPALLVVPFPRFSHVPRVSLAARRVRGPEARA